MSKPSKICTKCGKTTDTLYVDAYCYDCYEVIWDAGFEASSQWAAELDHNDKVGDLDVDASENAEEFRSTVLSILTEYDGGEWSCRECGQVRLTEADQKKVDDAKLEDILMSPCPGCGVTGFLDHRIQRP